MWSYSEVMEKKRRKKKRRWPVLFKKEDNPLLLNISFFLSPRCFLFLSKGQRQVYDMLYYVMFCSKLFKQIHLKTVICHFFRFSLRKTTLFSCCPLSKALSFFVPFGNLSPIQLLLCSIDLLLWYMIHPSSDLYRDIMIRP